MSVSEEFSTFVNARGISLDSLGVPELAFTPCDALAAIQLLRGGDVGVLGGDALIRKGNRIAFGGESWHCERGRDEDLEKWVKRSLDVAGQYISRFPNPADSVLFTIIWSESEIQCDAGS